MTASLYSLANFTCMAKGDTLLWSVGGNALTDRSNQGREISVTTNNRSVDVWSSILTIRALPINDGVYIGCKVVSYVPYIFNTKGATLTIGGVSPVEKLTFISNTNSTFLLTWSSPSFYSNDILQGSITTYHVIVKSKDGLILVNANTIYTFYKLPNTFSDCGYYTASVTAFIEQYSSLVSTTTKENTGSKIMLILFGVIIIIRLYY